LGVPADGFTAGSAACLAGLTGIVANGDLARANFAGDYKPRLVRTEEVDGEAMYVLELTAVDRA
jgi:hypothetical protein